MEAHAALSVGRHWEQNGSTSHQGQKQPFHKHSLANIQSGILEKIVHGPVNRIMNNSLHTSELKVVALSQRLMAKRCFIYTSRP